jgi:hypothetical protein
MKETENIKDCDVYQYLLITILISFLFFSCNNEKKKDSKNRDNIGYILKIPLKPKGLIVIFPKFGNDVNTTEYQTKIDNEAYKNNYASIIFDYNKQFILNKKDFYNIYNIIKTVIYNYNIPENEITIGGFSVGGTIALSYCIWINKLKKKINKPKKIFVGDSPVDLLDLYKRKEKFLKKESNKSKDEAKFIISLLDYSLGNPKKGISMYLDYSPYVREDIDNSNIKHLKGFTINFYSEPNLEWYKKTLNFDYQDTNSYQIELFINDLKRYGVENVNHIKTKNKGYINQKENPHSWSIINEQDFIDWVIN